MQIEGSLDLSALDAVLVGMNLDRGAWPLRDLYTGATTAAKEKLEEFIANRLDPYVATATSFVSHMSKYLHFGHISPEHVALRIREANVSRDALLNEEDSEAKVVFVQE